MTWYNPKTWGKKPAKKEPTTLNEMFGEERIAAAQAAGTAARAGLPVLDRLGRETRESLTPSQRRQLRAGTPSGQAALQRESAYVTAAHEGANRTDRAVKAAQDTAAEQLKAKQAELDEAKRQHEKDLAKTERDAAVAAARAEGERTGRAEERGVLSTLTESVSALAAGLNHNGADGRGSRK